MGEIGAALQRGWVAGVTQGDPHILPFTHFGQATLLAHRLSPRISLPRL
jgi:hypothetical protein